MPAQIHLFPHRVIYPPTVIVASQNRVLIADGTHRVRRWDGQSSSSDTAGIIAPTAKLTVPATNPAGSITTEEATAYYRFVDSDGLVSNLSPASDPITVTDSKITYQNVAVSSETKVVKRQVFRTLSGTANVAFLDVEIADNTATSVVSDNDDDAISLNESVTLSDADGNNLANLHDPPPTNKPILAHHLSRIFATGEVEYIEGHVEVTNGQTSVTGSGTQWTRQFEGRDLYVVGAPKPYRISTVADAGDTLTLTEAYGGPTNRFATYAIRSSPAQRRLVYYTEASLPESWPPVNSFALQETGDEITGLLSRGSFLYVLERSHIHRFTFQEDPAEDGAVFLVAYRGCINNRCWVIVEDSIYMLDQRGIHLYDGVRSSRPISLPIQELFRSGGDTEYRINWSASKWFHAAHYPAQETVRWFVALSGSYLPRHAICYHYRLDRFWIEEYTTQVGDSVLANIDIPRVILGQEASTMRSLSTGNLDGPIPTGTLRGTATGATLLTLTDSLANFVASGIVNAPVWIVSGRGKGQVRRIIKHTGTTLTVHEPWLVLPDTTSVYQIGAISWRWRSGWMKWLDEEESNLRRFGVQFSPRVNANTMDLRFYYDRASEPAEMPMTDLRDGVRLTKGSPDVVIDLTKPNGYAQQRLDSGREWLTDGERLVSIELQGHTTTEKVVVHQIDADGMLLTGNANEDR